MRPDRTDSVALRILAALRSVMAVFGRWVRGEVVHLVGGPARARVIVLFGGVLALSSADAATVGAVAPQLEHSLHIGNAKIGLLSSVGLLVGAVCVIPVGLFVDRVKRMPVLAVSIVLWSFASLMGAFSSSYWHLVLWRLALGAVTATAGPAIASLTGDYFPARERGRVYAYILAGETAGTAVGFIVSGFLASIISWRAAFVVLALPGFWLARELWRTVPEPARGGQSKLEPGAMSIRRPPSSKRRAQQRPSFSHPGEAPPGPDDWAFDGAYEQHDPEAQTEEFHDPPPPDEDLAYAQAEAQGVQPDPRLVLTEDPQKMTLGRAVSYTLSVPTNLMMIVGSSLGYFYFAGLQTFALLFVKGHYHVSQATSELGLGLLVVGALIGTVVSGQITDKMLRNGVLKARMLVPAGCYAAAVVCLIPGILGTHLTPSLWFDVAGAAFISAANPPLQAAKLDIMPAGLWGRAESTRTLARSLAQALAPLAFGGVADLIEGIAPSAVPVGAHAPHTVSHNATTGLEVSFLIMCAALAAAAWALWRAAHTYPTDVVTAGASQQASAQPPAEASGDVEPAPAPPRRRRRSRPVEEKPAPDEEPGYADEAAFYDDDEDG